jgi:hypothetical protein
LFSVFAIKSGLVGLGLEMTDGLDRGEVAAPNPAAAAGRPAGLSFFITGRLAHVCLFSEHQLACSSGAPGLNSAPNHPKFEHDVQSKHFYTFTYCRMKHLNGD